MAPSALLAIQNTVIEFADVISEVTGVNVDIMDRDYIRVAGSGFYAPRTGESMRSRASIYERVLEDARSIVVHNPGRDEICRACANRHTCTETIEIAAPIRLTGHVEGVIGLMAFTAHQRDMLLEKLDSYIHFVEQIADLIAKKAQENTQMQMIRIYTDTLTQILDSIDQCVLILTDDLHVRSANCAACKNLHLPENCLGAQIQLRATGDSIHGIMEYRMELLGRSYSIMGELYPMYVGTADAIQVLLFREKGQMQNDVYELTSSTFEQSLDKIVGVSPATLRLKERIIQVAQSMSTVLITGESGTGKELVANAIWKASERKDEMFVALNCAAIPEALLESELFGYVKGAFTGANPGGRMGKFELANHGVLFLDEIGDMPLYLQAKLLRVLQERTITRIGSNNQIKVDIRVIAATNKDLLRAIRENKFREDLYYRLNVIPLKIPPLRERPEDIDDLTALMIRRYSDRFQKRVRRVDADVMKTLRRYAWPGNVRELENTIEFMINMMDSSGVLTCATLPDALRERPAGAGGAGSIPTLEQAERQAILCALHAYGFDTNGKKNAARHLGIATSTLYKKLEKYGIRSDSDFENNS